MQQATCITVLRHTPTCKEVKNGTPESEEEPEVEAISCMLASDCCQEAAGR